MMGMTVYSTVACVHSQVEERQGIEELGSLFDCLLVGCIL